MPFLPVDTAIVVEVGPLIDDTDWQSLETGIVYNESGMSVKLLVNSGTSLRNTNITPSSGGSYDWTHKGGGVYELEIPSGLNANDTEGTLRVVGVCDGVLPFESPCYTVVPANVYNSLVKGTDVLDVSLTEIKGDAQSATDLKDFADAGYDPANNKVQGVVLVDTTTANSDMVGTDNAALASVATEARLAELDGANLPADVAAVKAETALIVADTNELQTDDVPGLIAALNDLSAAEVNAQVDTALSDIHLDHLLAVDYDPATPPGVATALLNELVESDAGVSRYTANALEQAPSGGASVGDIADAVWDELTTGHTTASTFGWQCKTLMDNLFVYAVNIQSDTNELQTDWTNGGRLDLILDAILADTNELQTDDVPGLIAALNDLSAAQVNAEVDTALADIHLDHLLAVDYDPAAKPGVATALLNELIESDAGVSRFTANALEQAPSGGASAADIADAVWDEPKGDHVAGASFGKAVGDIETDVTAVLADTNELQGDDVPGLIAGVQSDTDDIQTRLPASLVGGRMDADVQAISEDTGAADNLESMYDGTGYNADTAPASRAQVAALGLTGGGTLNFEANADNSGGTIDPGSTAFVGVETNNYTDTALEDGTYHVIADDTNIIDVVYGFSVGGGRTATEMIFRGFANANNDDLAVSAWNHATPGWDALGTLGGKPSTSNVNLIQQLLSRHTGTSATEIGKVYIRFNGSGLTGNADLNTDQILVEAVSIGQSVGYTAGAIWVDTNASNTNTEPFVDGVADNPVSTWAAALTLSSTLNITRFHIVNGSTIALSANSDNYTLSGSNWTLATASQSVVGIHVDGATVSGIMTGTGATQTFVNCHLLGCTHIKGLHALQCGIEGTQLVSEAGDYFLDSCHSGIAGTATWIFDFGGAIGSTNLNLRNYSGGVQLENMGDAGTDTASIEGDGQIIEGTCTGGVVAVRGHFTISGATNLTFSDDARYDVAQINAEVDAALADYDGPTHTELISEIDDVQTDVAAVKVDTAATLIDTNELQTDWTDGGRLDLILDAVLADTAEIGAAGVGLSAIPWNAAWDAEVESECNDALVALNLDHLLKVAVTGADVIDDSAIAQLAAKGNPADWDSFDNTTESLEALRDFFIAQGLVPTVTTAAYDTTTMIGRLLEKLRNLIDEPALNAKYTDAQLMSYVQPAYEAVLQDVLANSDAPIVIRYDLVVSDATAVYILPPVVGEILRLVKINGITGLPEWELPVRSRLNPSGPGFTIEGNTVRFSPPWKTSDTLQLEFIPTGGIEIHTGDTTTYDATSVTLSSSPTLGTLDKRENAYAGSILRALVAASDSSFPIQDRTITNYDAATRVATVNPAFSPEVPAATTLTYEVVPMIGRLMEDVVTYYAATLVLSGEGDPDRVAMLEKKYAELVRAIKLRLVNIENRVGDRFEHDTPENSRMGGWGLGSWGQS